MTVTDEEADAADAEARDVAKAVALLLNARNCDLGVAMIALSKVLAGMVWASAGGDPGRLSLGADLCNNAIRTFASNYAADDAPGPVQ